MKKLCLLIFVLVSLFLVFIIFYFKPKNFVTKYEIDGIKIVERFDKDESVYYFSFIGNEQTYDYSMPGKYHVRRRLINDVEIINNCLKIQANKIDSFEVCKVKDKYISSFYDKTFNEEFVKKYKNIEIFDLDNRTYFIWAYKEFIVLDSQKNQTIKLFNNDFYEIPLTMKIDDNILIADYDQKYTFDKMYFINSSNKKVKMIELDKKIYHNSYIMGNYKRSGYIYDMQEESVYKINPFKEEISKFDYKTIVNASWKEISINKLNKRKGEFSFINENFNYYIENGQLLYKTKNTSLSITNIRADKIIEQNGEEVIFLSNDTLYYVNLNKGIKKLLKYSEWEFNSNNIYIF